MMRELSIYLTNSALEQPDQGFVLFLLWVARDIQPARLAEWVSANFDPWLTDEEGTLLYRPDRYNTSQGKYVYIYFSRITGRRGHWCHCPLNGEDGHTDHCGDSIHPVLILKGKLDNVTQCRVANFSCSRDTRSKTFIILPQSVCVFLVFLHTLYKTLLLLLLIFIYIHCYYFSKTFSYLHYL